MANILVVDDKAANRQFLSTLFGDGRHHVTEAADGVEALAMVRSNKPDLVISDILMPNMDGFQFVAHMRHEDSIAQTPVIFWTANYADRKSEALAQACGVSRVLPKSTPAKEIIRSVEESLGLERLPVQAALPYRFDREHLCLLTNKLSREVAEHEKLAEIHRAGEKFLDDVSYEFLSPLAVIEWYCTAVRDGFAGSVSTQQMEFLNSALDCAHDLARLVDDLQDSSKLRVGTLRVDRMPHDVQVILASIRPDLQAKAAAKGIRLVEQIEANLPPVFVDAEKIGRVIANLVANAMTPSSAGSEVTLSVKRASEGGVEFAIRDAGLGIPSDQLKKLVEQNMLIDATGQSGPNGIGLGLVMARDLVALNLGGLDIQGEAGSGTTLSFTVPAMDWQEILTRFLERGRTGESAPSWVALLRASANADAEEIRSAMIAASSPSDLVMKSNEGEVLILGFSDDPTLWAQRIRETPAAQDLGIESETIGTWQNPAEQESARRQVLAQLHREVAYA